MSCIVQYGLAWFAAYLPWFSLHLLLSDDDCSVELGCPVVTRPPVSCERWCTAGYVVDWPEVHGGIEEAATGAECCCRMSGWTVVCLVHKASWSGSRALCLPSWGVLSRCVVDIYSFPNEWMNEFCWSEWPLFIQVTCSPACSAIGWLAELVGVARWM